MRRFRQVAGLAAILLSVVGLIVSIGVVCGGWFAKARADAVGDAVFQTADSSLAFIEVKLDAVRGLLGTSRTRVGRLSGIVDRLHADAPDAKEEARSLLETLNTEVFEPLREAESWLQSAQAVAVGVSAVSETFLSSEFAQSRQDSLGTAMAQTIQEYSQSVAQIMAELQQVREELVKLADKAVLTREIARRIVARLLDVETRLANLAASIEEFDAKVGRAKVAAAELDESFPRWTGAAAIAITILFGWFGISQIVTLRRGWRMVARPESR